MAGRLNLAVTGGSDCHGFSKGKPLIGGVKLPAVYLDKLKETRRKRPAASPNPPPNSAWLMGLLQKFKEGLLKTHSKLAHEIKRIVTASPKLTAGGLDDLEAALIAADLGPGHDRANRRRRQERLRNPGPRRPGCLFHRPLPSRAVSGRRPRRFERQPGGLTVVSIVGVNGTGKTTTAAKLARLVQARGQSRPAGRLRHLSRRRRRATQTLGRAHQSAGHRRRPGADPASVAHDAVAAALARKADYLFIDTAGRLHTKHNLMQELQKVHRVMDKKLPGAPHETLLVLDASTGMNALTQAREFNKAVPITGLVITKLDGTSKGGMVIAIQRELGLPDQIHRPGGKARRPSTLRRPPVRPRAL